MLNRIRKEIEARLVAFVRETYGVSLEGLVVETPPKIQLGELAFPFPFELAKKLRRSPRSIAEEVAGTIGSLPWTRKLEAAGAGYLNVHLDRALVFRTLYDSVLDGRYGVEAEETPGKIIVEHTNINPNKAAHIGHLRNAALGDTFVRILRFLGHPVETQNYIDNTGVQVADVVVGFQHVEKKSLDEVARTDGRFDYYCWDLYARISSFYQQNPERLELRQRALKEIEEGDNATAALGEHISTRIVEAHLNTMNRIGVRYDLLPRESDILHLKFWDRAFRLLKERNAIRLAEEGRNKGCWVMTYGDGEPGDGEPEEELQEKIIVRSNGTVTYVGKDIAYQLWKFGLLGLDFYYLPFHTYPGGSTVWITTSIPPPGDAVPAFAPAFGRAQRVYNVIDVRQSYLQGIVAAGVRALGYELQADNSIHFHYEMVALSPACCEELSIELSEEDRRRSYVEVSGRKGLGVKADDLLDALTKKAEEEVRKRHASLHPDGLRNIGRQIAISALRYFMIKFTRTSVIAFDFKEALGFEGETGPYLQYSVVRANNIFHKWRERGDWEEAALPGFVRENRAAPFLMAPEGNEFWEMVYHALRLSDTARQAQATLEVSLLAKYAFLFAQRFNLFYHRHHLLSEGDRERKLFLFALTDLFRKQLAKSLDLMGIEIPERM